MKKQGVWVVVFSFVVVMLLLPVKATDPYFVNVKTGDVFNLTEHQLFTFFVEGNDSDGQFPLNFTYGKDTGILVSFDFHSYNRTYGVINFTPGCTEIGTQAVSLIVTDNTTIEASVITVFFHVNNTNDPPNITSYYPTTNQLTVYENGTYRFNFTADDPDIPYGDHINNTWYLNGVKNSTNTTWFYKTSFCEPGNATVLLYVNDSHNANDTVRWNVTIINVNRKPYFDVFHPIPNLKWKEDTYLINNFSLVPEFFDDPDFYCNFRPDTPIFNVSGNYNITVNISKEPPYYVSFYPHPNFNGVNYVVITMSDGHANVSSNVFMLNVTPVPDAPLIYPIPDQDVYAYADFNYRVNATDPEGKPLNFSDNTSMFNISLHSGVINFTPTAADVGVHYIKINVTDVTDLTNSTVMKLTVHSNNPPYIYRVPNMNTSMGVTLMFQINAYDADGEAINITIPDDRFNKTWFNSTAANFTFVPETNGTVNVTAIAYDIHHAYNTTNFIINVSYFNFPPVIQPIKNPQVAKINEQYSFWVNASDGNGGKETLSYYDNTSLFDINKSTGWINFTPDVSEVGNYSVNITVCDDGTPVKCSSVSVLYVVTANRPPIIQNPGNFTIYEDHLFTLQINASDPDYDNITWYVNTTLFNISQSGLINFTPVDNVSGRNYSIMVNVTDTGNLSSFIVFKLDIIRINDPPYFNPNLSDMDIWNNIYEDNLTLIYINATDEEHDKLNFTLDFLKGKRIFNITVVNATKGVALINFTPDNWDVGNYTIRINVTDGVNVVSQNVSFEVINVDDPPEILMIYPTGKFISQFTYFNWSNASDPNYPDKKTQINVSEGMTILFNQTSRDIDDTNLTYKWTFNGKYLTNRTFINYTFDYDSPRTGIMRVTVTDPSGLSDHFDWYVVIKNVNRPPVFGEVYDNKYSTLSEGIFNNTVINASGVISLNSSNGTYVPAGTYISGVLDFRAETRLDILNFVSSLKTPPGTSVEICTASSPNKVEFSQWSPCVASSNFSVTTADERYMKYKLVMKTNNRSVTPYFSGAAVSYKIPDATIMNNNVYSAFLDLDDYFYDPDTDNVLNYSFSGGSHMKVSIDETNNVRIEPDGDYVGTDTLKFYATDGEDKVSSNTITFTILPGPGTGSSASSSSSSTRIVFQTQVVKEKETKYNMFDLISPEEVTVYKNETVAVPIMLKNTGNETLEDITLNASSQNKEINFTFSKVHFDELWPGYSVNTTLFATPYKIAGTYEILVSAHVSNPAINDTAKIMVNSREKGEQNASQINTKIAFTQDILTSNPACYELNEILDKARISFENKEYGKAESLLEKAIHDCRYLVEHSNATTESPMIVKKTNNLNTFIFAGAFSFIFVTGLGLILLYFKT